MEARAGQENFRSVDRWSFFGLGGPSGFWFCGLVPFGRKFSSGSALWAHFYFMYCPLGAFFSCSALRALNFSSMLPSGRYNLMYFLPTRAIIFVFFAH